MDAKAEALAYLEAKDLPRAKARYYSRKATAASVGRLLPVPFLIETNMSEETTIPARKRVLSGMRPTGKLHLGNYMGALKNWVALQNETFEDGSPKYECFFFIADYHALTTDYADTNELRENVRQVALDFLAAGLDPKKSTIFLQSEVPTHFVLNSLLEMITPLSWLERVPTYKDQQEQLREKDLATIGFLGYPVLQSADILVYQAEFVPVGIDQAAHVEITREIARRFNHLYGSKGAPVAAGSDKERLAELEQATDVRQILPEPKVLLTPSPKLPGTDGRKMSKSYGNTILLSETEADLRAKLKTMVTDPARVRRTDPGNPEVCPVFDLHKVFSSGEVQAQAAEGCRTAGIGCIQCKGWLADAVVTELAPIRERRQHFEANPDDVDAILDEGAFRANGRTAVTMRQVFAAVGLSRR
ncbi:MAG TPA: tryptophan--tRNA ligase [Acidobacteriaceae bacterium]